MLLKKKSEINFRIRKGLHKSLFLSNTPDIMSQSKEGKNTYDEFCIHITEFSDELLDVLSGIKKQWNQRTGNRGPALQ